MKKLLFLLTLTLLFSCEKEAEYCWNCQVTKTTTFSGGSSSVTSTQTKCNMSTREMELFEQGSGGTTAICTRQ